MSIMNTAERLEALYENDRTSVRWSWAVICIGAGGIRHRLNDGNLAYRFEDGSAIEINHDMERGEQPKVFNGTFTSTALGAFAFRR